MSPHLNKTLTAMNWGKPCLELRTKGRGTKVSVAPIPWPQVSSHEATARGATAGLEVVAEAVVAVVVTSGTADTINIISIISSSGIHSITALLDRPACNDAVFSPR